jgi:hypothetical protein
MFLPEVPVPGPDVGVFEVERIVMQVVFQGGLHAPEERVRVGGEKEAAAGDQSIAEALQKVPPPPVGALQVIVPGRVGEQVKSRAHRLRPQKRQHHGEIAPDEPDVFKAGCGGLPDGAIERFLGQVDAEEIDMRESPRPGARKHAGAAAEVDFQRPAVAEQVRRCQAGEAVRLAMQVAAVPAAKVFRGGLPVGRVDMDAGGVSSSGHDRVKLISYDQGNQRRLE